MNVLVLNYEFPPLGGGAGNATYHLARELGDHEELSLDIVTSSISQYKVEQPFNNTTVHYLDIGKRGNLHYQTNKELLAYSWKSYQYSKSLIAEKKFDLVHAFFGIPSGYIAAKLPLPYIVSLRGSDVPFYSERFAIPDRLLFRRLSRRIWRNAEFVVANSAGLRELALQSSPQQPISVIHNGIDTQTFVPATVKNTNSRRITLVSTGRLIERKGYSYLVRALQGLEQCRLVLVGGGILERELMQLARSLDVDVEFAGPQPREKVVDFLQRGDIFVLPSLNEGMSNSVLEAMACGLPIIATDVGGSIELVKENGFIVEKGSVESLRAVIEKYTNDRKLIQTHGENSRKRAESMSWQKVADNYLQLYRKTLSRD